MLQDCCIMHEAFLFRACVNNNWPIRPSNFMPFSSHHLAKKSQTAESAVYKNAQKGKFHNSFWTKMWHYLMDFYFPFSLPPPFIFLLFGICGLIPVSNVFGEKHKRGLECVLFGWSGPGPVMRDHMDHNTSKEPMKPPWERIHWFIWCKTMQSRITDP